MLVFQNERLLGHVRDRYAPENVDALLAFLRASGTFEFRALDNGLFPAAAVIPNGATGYDRVWVRDNVHIAHALAGAGMPGVAAKNVQALARFFRSQTDRFEAITRGRVDPANRAFRPAIRFAGETLDSHEKWPNAQNDALGYFLWLYSRLARELPLGAGEIAWDVLALFPPYLRAIAYWRDEDSGHWEETPKVCASSIGTVVAGLRELRGLLSAATPTSPDAEVRAGLAGPLIDDLIDEGERSLAAILPAECVQPNSRQRRRYDAALLFLVEPLHAVDAVTAERIVDEVLGNLAGEVGIRRYRGDSFWCADYRNKLPPEERTADWSGRTAERDALCRPGEEAEWCLFDPVISVIFGRRFERTRAPEWRERQIHHLNRSLGHLTASTGPWPELRCPELYHREGGRWEPSDATPLLWTQALLLTALRAAREDARR